jgi:hypothetical protein
MPAPTLPDGSELIEPIRCDRCDALAYFVLKINDQQKPEIEIRYFNAPRAAPDGAAH